MPKIVEYTAPKSELHPTDLGYTAFETAGRRIGGMYHEAAQAQIEGAKIAGEMAARDIEWPYILQDLLNPASKGTSVKSGGGGSSSKGGASSTNTDLSKANAAADALLGNENASQLPYLAARDKALGLGQSTQESYDPATGASTTTPLSALRAAVASSFGSGPDIGASNYVGPNAAAEAAANKYGYSTSGSGTYSTGTYSDTGAASGTEGNTTTDTSSSVDTSSLTTDTGTFFNVGM